MSKPSKITSTWIWTGAPDSSRQSTACIASASSERSSVYPSSVYACSIYWRAGAKVTNYNARRSFISFVPASIREARRIPDPPCGPTRQAAISLVQHQTKDSDYRFRHCTHRGEKVEGIETIVDEGCGSILRSTSRSAGRARSNCRRHLQAARERFKAQSTRVSRFYFLRWVHPPSYCTVPD